MTSFSIFIYCGFECIVSKILRAAEQLIDFRRLHPTKMPKRQSSESSSAGRRNVLHWPNIESERDVQLSSPCILHREHHYAAHQERGSILRRKPHRYMVTAHADFGRSWLATNQSPTSIAFPKGIFPRNYLVMLTNSRIIQSMRT